MVAMMKSLEVAHVLIDFLKIGILGSLLAGLASCAQVNAPKNLEPVAQGRGYQAQYRAVPKRKETRVTSPSPDLNASHCLSFRGGEYDKSRPMAQDVLLGDFLSRNDLLDVRIDQDKELSGQYVVSRSGTLSLPFLPPIPAQGRSTSAVEQSLKRALVASELYDNTPAVSVRVMDVSSVLVGVSGAVFEPHQIELGGVAGDQLDALRQGAIGASTESRNLSAGLRASGGVRPDADLSAVELTRGGTTYMLDLRGVLQGQNMVDVMLLTGDQIFVPSRGCFQDDLMRPSPVSPVGISMFMSNLSQPATGNAPSAVGREVREMPYGTRYLQAVIDLNCVGGPRSTSGHRSAVLLSRNPVSDVSVAIERDIEALISRADRDDYNPYILPGDAMACYDSTVTNLAEVGRVLGLVTLGRLVN